MQWSRENWSPHSTAFYCLCWGNQPLLAVQTSRGVCFSCCFSTQRTSLCDLLSFWRLCRCEGDWWTGTSHFSASDTTSYLQWAATAFHLAAAAAGNSPLGEDCTLLLKHLDFICITIFHTLLSHSLSPHLHGLSVAGGVTVPCAPHALHAAAELWWVLRLHWSLRSWESSAVPLSAIQGCQHWWCKVLGEPWWCCGPLLALVTEQSCEGCVHCLSWDRTNMSQLSGIDFWQRIQETAAVLAFLYPPPLYYNACCSEILNSAINNLLYQQHAFALFEMVLWGR